MPRRSTSAGTCEDRVRKPPQQAGQPQHQLPLHCRLGVVIGHNGCFERLVVLRILQHTDDGLGRETVADRVAAGTLFAFFGDWTGAFAGVVTIGLDLPKGSHVQRCRVLVP